MLLSRKPSEKQQSEKEPLPAQNTAPATQNGGLDAHSHKRDKSTVTNDAPTFTLLYWQHCRHTAGKHSSQHSKFSLKI